MRRSPTMAAATLATLGITVAAITGLTVGPSLAASDSESATEYHGYTPYPDSEMETVTYSTQCGGETVVTLPPDTEYWRYEMGKVDDMIWVGHVFTNYGSYIDPNGAHEFLGDESNSYPRYTICPIEKVEAPTVTPAATCGPDTLTLPKVEGLDYSESRTGNTVHVAATPRHGYTLPEGATTTWHLTLAEKTCPAETETSDPSTSTDESDEKAVTPTTTPAPVGDGDSATGTTPAPATTTAGTTTATPPTTASPATTTVAASTSATSTPTAPTTDTVTTTTQAPPASSSDQQPTDTKASGTATLPMTGGPGWMLAVFATLLVAIGVGLLRVCRTTPGE